MPTYYAPGKRKYRKSGKVYTNTSYVVRGRIDGHAHEYTTGALVKKGREGAEEKWEQYKLTIRSAAAPDITRETATFSDAVLIYRRANPDMSVSEGRYLDRLEQYMGGDLLAGITATTLKDAAIAIYPTAKPQTRNRQAISVAGAVMHYACRARLVEWLRVERFREVNPYRPIARQNKGEVVIAAAKRLRKTELAVLLETLVYMGWRITETLSIELDKIYWQLSECDRWVTKSREWRRTAVEPGVLAAWETLPRRNDGKLFSFKDRREVYRAIDELGLDFNYRPHMSRRGFATDLNDLGVTLTDIASAAQGWKDPRSVSVYVQTDIKQNQATLGKLRGKTRVKAKKAVA